MDPHFEPEYFAHGRLLWRFEGSDAVRFSPRLAWGMVEGAAEISAGAGWLWDPFSGAGLIPAVARAFFASAFVGIAASDASLAAVETTVKNLALVSDLEAAAKRLAHVRGLRGQNPKSDRRWGEVAAYLERLLPNIEAAASIAREARVECALAHEQLPRLAGEAGAALYIVGDAPYGRGSELLGPPIDAIVQGWVNEPSVAYVDLVCTPQQLATLSAGEGVTARSGRGGRARWTYVRA